MTVDAIKEAIVGLSQEEKVSLTAWLNLNTMDDWDMEMQRDFSPGGKAHALVGKVQADIRAGKFSPMSKGRSRGRE